MVVKRGRTVLSAVGKRAFSVSKNDITSTFRLKRRREYLADDREEIHETQTQKSESHQSGFICVLHQGTVIKLLEKPQPYDLFVELQKDSSETNLTKFFADSLEGRSVSELNTVFIPCSGLDDLNKEQLKSLMKSSKFLLNKQQRSMLEVNSKSNGVGLLLVLCKQFTKMIEYLQETSKSSLNEAVFNIIISIYFLMKRVCMLWRTAEVFANEQVIGFLTDAKTQNLSSFRESFVRISGDVKEVLVLSQVCFSTGSFNMFEPLLFTVLPFLMKQKMEVFLKKNPEYIKSLNESIDVKTEINKVFFKFVCGELKTLCFLSLAWNSFSGSKVLSSFQGFSPLRQKYCKSFSSLVYQMNDFNSFQQILFHLIDEFDFTSTTADKRVKFAASKLVFGVSQLKTSKTEVSNGDPIRSLALEVFMQSRDIGTAKQRLELAEDLKLSNSFSGLLLDKANSALHEFKSRVDTLSKSLEVANAEVVAKAGESLELRSDLESSKNRVDHLSKLLNEEREINLIKRTKEAIELNGTDASSKLPLNANKESFLIRFMDKYLPCLGKEANELRTTLDKVETKNSKLSEELLLQTEKTKRAESSLHEINLSTSALEREILALKSRNLRLEAEVRKQAGISGELKNAQAKLKRLKSRAKQLSSRRKPKQRRGHSEGVAGSAERQKA